MATKREQPGIDPAHDQRRKRRHRRMRIIFLLAFAFVLVGIEAAAWIIDSQANFRLLLLEALDAMVIRNEPADGATAPRWSSPQLLVRSPVDSPGTPEPYLLGGHTIPQADARMSQQLVTPETFAGVRGHRVFIIGGSAAQGIPYRYEHGFASLLQRKLHEHGFESLVINAAQAGWSSGRLIPVAKRIVDHYQPNTLIIFMGNNEFTSFLPDGQPRANQTSVKLRLFFAHSRSLAWLQYLLLEKTLRSQDSDRRAQTGYHVHHELSGSDFALKHPAENELTWDASQWPVVKQTYVNQFERNLTEIVTHAKSRGVRVILMTVPINYRLSPAWKHPQPQSFDPTHREQIQSAIHQAHALLQSGSANEAISVIDQSLVLQPQVPMLHYLKGQCLEKLGRHLEAEQAYAQCRENMIGWLGSPLSMNEATRKVARSQKTMLVDLPELFDSVQRHRGGHYNEELIHDDCHPTPLGHEVITAALTQAILHMYRPGNEPRPETSGVGNHSSNQ